MSAPNYIEALKTKSAHIRNISDLCNDYSNDADYLAVTQLLQNIVRRKLEGFLDQMPDVNLSHRPLTFECFKIIKPKLMLSLSSYRDNLQIFMCKLSGIISRRNLREDVY
jgi:hypothetical protein